MMVVVVITVHPGQYLLVQTPVTMLCIECQSVRTYMRILLVYMKILFSMKKSCVGISPSLELLASKISGFQATNSLADPLSCTKGQPHTMAPS